MLPPFWLHLRPSPFILVNEMKVISSTVSSLANLQVNYPTPLKATVGLTHEVGLRHTKGW